MSERAARIGRNEALFRQVNEQVEGLSRTFTNVRDPTMHVVCECGQLSCVEGLVVPLATYERIRADPALFFVIPGHEAPDVEEVVEEEATYNVVRKNPGEPEEIAAKTDPRS